MEKKCIYLIRSQRIVWRYQRCNQKPLSGNFVCLSVKRHTISITRGRSTVFHINVWKNLFVCNGVHVLFMLFVFICIYWYSTRFPYQLMFVLCISKTTGEAGTANPYGASEFIPGFNGSSCCSIFSFWCNVLLIVVCPFLFGHCVVVYPSSYGFWLYLQTIRGLLTTCLTPTTLPRAVIPTSNVLFTYSCSEVSNVGN